MQGVIVFLNSYIGTKSESVQPFLYTGMGTLVRLYKSGDNPFENESLVPYDSKTVYITGKTEETQILLVESITLCHDLSLQEKEPERDKNSDDSEKAEGISL